MMCPDDRTVDHVGTIITFDRTGQCLQHGIEYTRRCPATVAAEHAVPLAICLRQLPPLRTRPRSDGNSGPISDHSSSDKPIRSPKPASKWQP